MELDELIGKLHKESNEHVPEVRDKVVTRAKAEGLLELTPASETVAYNNGSSASLAMRKKGWIAAAASALIVALACLVIGLAIMNRGGATPPVIDNGDTPPAILPPDGETEKSDRALGGNYAAGVVSTARLMESFVPETLSVKPVRVRAKAAAVAMPDVDYISDFNGYLNAFGTFFGEELAYYDGVSSFDGDKYDNCVSVGGMLANGDPVSYNFYYSEYKVIESSVTDGSERYYLEGGIDLGTDTHKKQFTVIGERIYAAGATAESSLRLCIYPDFENKKTYGEMELEYAADGSETLTKYSYTVIKDGASVSEAKAYRPTDGAEAFVVEINGIKGSTDGKFSVGKPAAGTFNVSFTLGGAAGNFTAVQTADKKYKYDNVLMGQFTFNLNDDGTCVLTGYDKRTALPETVIIPDTCGGNKVITIGQSAFENCADIKKVTVPDGVTSVETGAFKGCYSLVEVRLPDGVKIIENDTFKDCVKLTSVRLPADLKEIGFDSFKNCYNLESIALPETLEKLGSAFKNCEKLKSLHIPASVTYISNNAISECISLESLTVASGNAVYKSVENCIIEPAENKLLLGCKTSVIPADGSIKKIGACAFDGCTGLTSIDIPESVTEIEAFAFYGSGLQSLNLPEGVESVLRGAFDYCFELRTVYLPASLTYMPENPFRYCYSLEGIRVADNGDTFISDGDCLIKKDENILISGCKNSIIPEYVSIIGDEAFAGCIGLQSIVIPASVNAIGNYAFNGCRGLTDVEIMNDGEKGVEIIGIYAFADCGIMGIILPDSVKSVGEYAFRESALLTAVLSSNLEAINLSVFEDCYQLQKVSFNNGVSNLISIYDNAFRGCRSLESFIIPESVRFIGYGAFSDSGIASVSIPDGVADLYPEGNSFIADSLFKYCSNLRYVHINSTVKDIYNQAFYDCINLERIDFYGTMEQWKEVNKHAGWDYNTGNYVVQCLDGVLDKDGNVIVSP